MLVLGPIQLNQIDKPEIIGGSERTSRSSIKGRFIGAGEPHIQNRAVAAYRNLTGKCAFKARERQRARARCIREASTKLPPERACRAGAEGEGQ